MEGSGWGVRGQRGEWEGWGCCAWVNEKWCVYLDQGANIHLPREMGIQLCVNVEHSCCINSPYFLKGVITIRGCIIAATRGRRGRRGIVQPPPARPHPHHAFLCSRYGLWLLMRPSFSEARNGVPYGYRGGWRISRCGGGRGLSELYVSFLT